MDMQLIAVLSAMLQPVRKCTEVESTSNIDWLYEIADSTVQVWYDMLFPRRAEKRLFELKEDDDTTKKVALSYSAKKNQTRPIADMQLLEFQHLGESFVSTSSNCLYFPPAILETFPLHSLQPTQMLYVRDIEMSQGCYFAAHGDNVRSSEMSPTFSNSSDSSKSNSFRHRPTKWQTSVEVSRNKWHSKPKYCTFCFRNGESASVYGTHFIRDAMGRITCPVLFYVICRNCGATGENAHTEQHCPMLRYRH